MVGRATQFFQESSPSVGPEDSLQRLSSALDFDALDDESNRNMTADQLYDIVDKDGDGTITRGEFTNMYGVLKKHVHTELVKERSFHARADVAEQTASRNRRRNSGATMAQC